MMTAGARPRPAVQCTYTLTCTSTFCQYVEGFVLMSRFVHGMKVLCSSIAYLLLF